MMKYRLPCRKELDGIPSAARRFAIPMVDTMFYATLRRGYAVDLLPNDAYTEAVNMWPHPTHGYIVFPMTLPCASDLEHHHPAFAKDGEGLCGHWRLETKEGVPGLTLALVRKLEIREFWTLVCKEGVNPVWLEPCFAEYRDVEFEALAHKGGAAL